MFCSFFCFWDFVILGLLWSWGDVIDKEVF